MDPDLFIVSVIINRSAKHSLNWKESDAKYKARGRRMATRYNPEWGGELEEMNKNKAVHSSFRTA